MKPVRLIVTALILLLSPPLQPLAVAAERLRVLIETDAGGDPDDEQSLVRFLLYCNEWDVEGIICTCPKARDGENLNPERTGLVVGHLNEMADFVGEAAQFVKIDHRILHATD